MNLFEKASKEKLRFPSPKGVLTVEQVWDLPLTSEKNLSLDSLARAVNAELKSVTSESFVETQPHPDRASHQLRLDIVKHVIAHRQDENKRTRDIAARAERRKILESALADKQTEAIKGKSVADIEKELAELSD